MPRLRCWVSLESLFDLFKYDWYGITTFSLHQWEYYIPALEKLCELDLSTECLIISLSDHLVLGSFSTTHMGVAWLPTVMRSQHTFLSTLNLASAYMHAVCGRDNSSDEQPFRIILQTIIFRLINTEMEDPPGRTSDLTILAVVQLILSELVEFDRRRIEVHLLEIRRMVQLRGALPRLGVGGDLAALVTA